MAISYDDIWKKIIWENLSSFSTIEGLVFLNEGKIKTKIKENFDHFCELCIKKYMDPDKVVNLDRHKIAACIMFAIMSTDMYEKYPSSASDAQKIIITEQIAISVGLSVLRTYIVNELDSSYQKKNKKTWEKDKAIFGNGFKLPGEFSKDEVNHGDYRSNFAMELYFTKSDNIYNILSLSNSLYLLEMYNRQLWEIQNALK